MNVLASRIQTKCLNQNKFQPQSKGVPCVKPKSHICHRLLITFPPNTYPGLHSSKHPIATFTYQLEVNKKVGHLFITYKSWDFSFLLFKFYLFLFIWKEEWQRKWDRDTEGSSVVSLPGCLQQLGQGQAGASSLKLLLGLPCEWQGLNHDLSPAVSAGKWTWSKMCDF